MSCFRGLFCCDTSVQLLNIDVTCEVVKISLRNDGNAVSSSALRRKIAKPGNSRPVMTTKVYNTDKPMIRSLPLKNTSLHPSLTVRQPLIRNTPVIYNKGDNDDSINLNDSTLAAPNKEPPLLPVKSGNAVGVEDEKTGKTELVPVTKTKKKIRKATAIMKGSKTQRTESDRKLEENLSEVQKRLHNLRHSVTARNKLQSIKPRQSSRKKSPAPPPKKAATSMERTPDKAKKAEDKKVEESGTSVLVPSDNSSFSFTPTVVKPVLAEKYKFEAEFATKLAMVTKQIKESSAGPSAFTVSNSAKSTACPGSIQGTPTKKLDAAVGVKHRVLNI